MADSLEEYINKNDLETILKVNQKAIEISSDVSSQNEEVLDLLGNNKHLLEGLHDKTDKIIVQNENLSRDLFQVKAFFVAGFINLILQIVQLFVKK